MDDHGNVMRQRYKVMTLKLHFKVNDTRWTTEEEFEMLAEEGRFWSEKIFDAILFFAKKCKATLGSYLENKVNWLSDSSDVVDTCERCLERLRPEVFFSEEATASSGMTQPSLSTLL